MESQVEIIQINIAGKDQPGLTSSLTDILARYDAFILDIGQANIHQSLTLGILIKTTSDKSGAIMKELLFKSSELGINIRFTPISEERYTAWVGMQGKNRYIITLLGRQLTARHIADVAGVISRQGLNIDAIKRMTAAFRCTKTNGRPSRASNSRCADRSPKRPRRPFRSSSCPSRTTGWTSRSSATTSSAAAGG